MECRALPVLRCLALAGVLAGLSVTDSFAQDLRGAIVTGPPTMNWRGFYGGAQFNYNNADVDFQSATGTLVNRVLRNTDILANVSSWQLLQDSSTNSSGFGGFVGYNWQFDDMVVGVEGNYNRTRLSRWANDSMTRSFINNDVAPPDHTYTYTVRLDGSGTVNITDLGTFRARAGWAFGSFLTYGFVGLAVGRADVTTSVNVSGELRDDYTIPALCPDGTGGVVACNLPRTDYYTLPPGKQSETQNGKWVYGGAVGLGFDWALTQNLFMRGEWELVKLVNIEGIDVRLNTGRVGLGVKF